jgi:hypothetical protein
VIGVAMSLRVSRVVMVCQPWYRNVIARAGEGKFRREHRRTVKIGNGTGGRPKGVKGNERRNAGFWLVELSGSGVQQKPDPKE